MKDFAVCHFWVGHFPAGTAEKYFEEIWNEEDEDREYTPLSAFARDQGQMWYDHDFLEVGIAKPGADFATFIAGHSWSTQWAPELTRRLESAGLKDVNVLAFIAKRQIESPQSVQGDDFWLHYLGEIEIDP